MTFKTLKTTLFFLTVSFAFYGQTLKKDSLKYQGYMTKSWELRNNFDEASKYTSKAYELAKRKNDSNWVAQTFYYNAIFKYYAGEYKKTLIQCDSAAKWYPNKNAYGTASVYNLKGLVATNTDSFIDAINYYQKSLEFAKKTDNLYAISNPNHNIGILYEKLNQNKEALKYFFKALSVREEIKDSTIIYQSYLSIGTSYYYQSKIDSAKYYLKKIIAEEKNIADERTRAYAYNNLGLLYLDNDDFKKSAVNFLEAEKLHKTLKNDLGIAKLNNNLAKLNLKKKNYQEGIIKAKIALKFAKKVSSKQEEVNAYETIAQNFQLLKSKDSALIYYNKFIIKKDSLIDESKAKRIAELQIKYDFKEKENQLLKTKAEKANTELKLTNQKQFTYALLGGLALLLLAGFAVFQRNKRKHMQAIALEKEKNLKTIIITEEKERTRIARELHDGIVQQIAVVLLKTRDFFEKKNLKNLPESSEILSDLKTSNEDLRTISHQMMPRALEKEGLVTALQNLLNSSFSSTNIKHTFDYFGIEERLPKNIEITIYRITQELVNNILKHSQASEISVGLYKNPNQITFIVEDNGKGFSFNNNKGIGLANIKSRIDLIKGSVNFEGKKGLLVTVNIPINKK